MTLLYIKHITCISVLLVVLAALLPQLDSSTSFSTKMDTILHQPQSLPRVDPHRSLSTMKRPIQDIAVGLRGDKGADGEVFHSWRQMSHAAPPTHAQPPNVNTDTHRSSSSGSKQKPSASNNMTGSRWNEINKST